MPQPAPERVEQIKEIVERLMEKEHPKYGKIMAINAFLPATLKDDGVSPELLEAMGLEEVALDELETGATVILQFAFERTDHNLILTPTVAPRAQAQHAAPWIWDMINESPTPPDLQPDSEQTDE